MKYFDVYVVDRVTKSEVCIGCLLTRSEAMSLMRVFNEYDVDAYFVQYFYKNGRRIEL